MDHKNISEQEFLTSYDKNNFDRPSIAVDISLFSVIKEATNNYRKLPQPKLQIILIKRGKHPFMGQWSLPGGFLKKDESVEETAKRKLFEETGVNQSYLCQLGVFSEKGRDPRGWIITTAFVSLVEHSRLIEKLNEHSDDVRWFDVSLDKTYEQIENNVQKVFYELTLSSDEILLKEKICHKIIRNIWGTEEKILIIEKGNLAFDHSIMIAKGLFHIRETAFLDETIFALVPPKFTLTELQNIYECVLGRELLKADFRRRMKNLVEETTEYRENAGHRPSKLFVRKHLEELK